MLGLDKASNKLWKTQFRSASSGSSSGYVVVMGLVLSGGGMEVGDTQTRGLSLVRDGNTVEKGGEKTLHFSILFRASLLFFILLSPSSISI